MINKEKGYHYRYEMRELTDEEWLRIEPYYLLEILENKDVQGKTIALVMTNCMVYSCSGHLGAIFRTLWFMENCL